MNDLPTQPATSFDQFVAERHADASAEAKPWAERICIAWQKTTEHIIQTGQLLLAARDELPHGSFQAMVESDLPFDVRTAQMLMKIAEHPVISNAKHVSLLPPSWGTLYQLALLPPAILEQHIEEGTITPDMERKDAAALKPKTRAPSERPPKESTEKQLRRELEAQREHIAELEANASHEEAPATGNPVKQCLKLINQMTDEQRADFVAKVTNEIDAVDLALNVISNLDEDEFPKFVTGFSELNNGYHVGKKPGRKAVAS
jgi:hypothetical protein